MGFTSADYSQNPQQKVSFSHIFFVFCQLKLAHVALWRLTYFPSNNVNTSLCQFWQDNHTLDWTFSECIFFFHSFFAVFNCRSLFNPLGPRPPVTTRSFALPRNPRLPGSGRLADAPYKHLGLCKYLYCCSLVSTIVYYFWRCCLFEVQWSLRDAVNFQNCEVDVW